MHTISEPIKNFVLVSPSKDQRIMLKSVATIKEIKGIINPGILLFIPDKNICKVIISHIINAKAAIGNKNTKIY